jgi:RNA polymerase sigma factor (sigma-70 family)
MAHGWESPTLKEWCASMQARQLAPADETSRAAQIAEGAAARSELQAFIAPRVKDYLHVIAGDEHIIRPADRSDLAGVIVDTALDLWATSARPPADFIDHLTKAFCGTVCHHFDVRRRRGNDFWINDEAWLEEHFNAGKLRESLDAKPFADAARWKRLAHAGSAINDLVQHGLSIVPNVVASLCGHGIERLGREDAESEAILELRRLAWQYSPTEGQRFHQFAFASLRKALLSKIRTTRGLTQDLARKRAHFEKVKSRLWVALEREPTNEEVLSGIDSWGERAKESFRRFLEIRDPLPQNWDGALETLPSGRDEEAEAIISRREHAQALAAAMERLADDERVVVTCRFIHGMSKADTARQIGKSATVVARLEQKALMALRRCRELAHDE